MIEVLGQPFFQNALIAGMVVALMCSFLGVYVLLKRVVFVGFALSQIASAGGGRTVARRAPPAIVFFVRGTQGQFQCRFDAANDERERRPAFKARAVRARDA